MSTNPGASVPDQATFPSSRIDGNSDAITSHDSELFAGASPSGTDVGVVDRPGLRMAGQIAYPVVVLALIIGVVLLGSYVASRPAPAAEEAAPPVAAVPNPPAPPGAADAVAALIDPSLVEVTTAEHGADGVRIEGDLTEAAMAAPEALGAHLEGVLANNCVDNLHLVTADNLTFDFWGHCFTTQPAALIAETLSYADASGAKTVSLQDYPGSGNYRRASYVWQTADRAEYDRVAADWQEQEMPEGLNAINYTQYGAGALADQMVYADLTREGLDLHRAPETE